MILLSKINIIVFFRISWYHRNVVMWQVHFYEDNDMRIERVDEKTVKCFLSNEELEEYEIDYKDFVLRSDKAREVVQEIIEQAAEEEIGRAHV